MVKYIIEGGINFYEELYKSFDEKETDIDTNSECQITGLPLADRFVTMECNHKFNYTALYKDIYNQKFVFRSYTYSSLSDADKGKFDKAIELYTEALGITPNPAYVMHDRGMVYLQKGEFDKAISDFSKAMEINPDEKDFVAQCYNDRGNVYYEQEQYEKSWQDVQKAIELGYKVHPGFIEALKKEGYSK